MFVIASMADNESEHMQYLPLLFLMIFRVLAIAKISSSSGASGKIEWVEFFAVIMDLDRLAVRSSLLSSNIAVCASWRIF